ncbi:hypothetical protein J6590_100274, partial [Homalodisca vitripennis]
MGSREDTYRHLSHHGAAIGKFALFYGVTTTFLIGGCFKDRTLVANIEESFILGMDLLPSFGLGLDLKKKVLTQTVINAEAEEEIDEEQSIILEPKSDDEKLGPGVLVAGRLFLTGKAFPGDAKPIRQNLR